MIFGNQVSLFYHKKTQTTGGDSMVKIYYDSFKHTHLGWLPEKK